MSEYKEHSLGASTGGALPNPRETRRDEREKALSGIPDPAAFVERAKKDHLWSAVFGFLFDNGCYIRPLAGGRWTVEPTCLTKFSGIGYPMGMTFEKPKDQLGRWQDYPRRFGDYLTDPLEEAIRVIHYVWPEAARELGLEVNDE